MSERIERAVAKGVLASELALTGAVIAGPAGAAVGATAGLIVGDQTTVFGIDMVAIPAFQAYMIQGTPSTMVYIKQGETLLPTGGEVQDVAQVVGQELPEAKPKKRRSKYQTAYNRFFKANKSKYTLKNGKFRKGGFKALVKASHAAARKATGGGK